MRVYTLYRTSATRKPGGSGFHWLLAAMLAVFMIWVWWKNLQHHESDSASDSPSRLPVVARNGATNAVASRFPARGRDGFSNGPRVPRNTYELQVALARHVCSVGSLDGIMGSQTRAALRAFQQKERLRVTGEFDAATKAILLLTSQTERQYTITLEDLSRLSPVGATWLAKSLQDRLDYENILELVAEQGHAHPNMIRMLNPSVDWNNVRVGATLRIPDVQYPAVRMKAATLRIRLREKTLVAFDSRTNLIAHFPCSIARQVEKRPVGKLEVETIAFNPNYKFTPEIFPESEEARQLKRPLMIPQGPNNPVGTAWIGLTRPGYGIHGTPRPEEVGRTESHGCFRLANWNAEFLAQLVEVGTPVWVEP